MCRWPPRPRKCRFIKEMYWISNEFVEEARIVEYGLLAAAAPRPLPKGARGEEYSCNSDKICSQAAPQGSQRGEIFI